MTIRDFWYNLARDEGISETLSFLLFVSSLSHFFQSLVFRQTLKTTPQQTLNIDPKLIYVKIMLRPRSA